MRDIYILGNEHIEGDDLPTKIDIKDPRFKIIHEKDPLRLLDKDDLFIIDYAEGINNTTILTEKDLDRLKTINSVTCHDLDFATLIKLKQSTGQKTNVKIIALPVGKKIDKERLKEIILENL